MSTNAATQNVPQVGKPDYQQTTLKVPVDVWRAVRIAALDRRVDAQHIWVEAVREYLKLAA